MDIEQHAEAAAEEIDRSMTDGPKAIIAKHMQAAIDEATAPLKARIAALEGLGPLIEIYACKRMNQAEAEAIDEWGDRKMFENQADKYKAKINAILKGGAE